jgi:hypothetical protein
MSAALRWAPGLALATVVMVPMFAEANSYTFSNCQSSQLCATPATQPVSTQASPAYDFSNEAAVAASIAAVYFDSNGSLPGITQIDQSTAAGPSDPTVAGPEATLADRMAFTDIISALDEGSSTADSIRIAAHVQGMDSNGTADIFMARESLSVPEPAMVALFGLGLVAAAARARRRR